MSSQKRVYNRYEGVENSSRVQLYRQNFRAKDPEYFKRYYLENREKYYIEMRCTFCEGVKFDRAHVKRHLDSKRHKLNVVKQMNSQNDFKEADCTTVNHKGDGVTETESSGNPQGLHPSCCVEVKKVDTSPP